MLFKVNEYSESSKKNIAQLLSSNKAVVSCIGFKYIEIIKGSHSVILPTEHSSKNTGCVELSEQVKEYLNLSTGETIFIVFHEELDLPVFSDVSIKMRVTSKYKPTYQEVLDDCVDLVESFKGIPLKTRLRYNYRGKEFSYLFTVASNYDSELFFFIDSVKIIYGPSISEVEESVFNDDVDFSKLDIGGLDSQIKTILRTMFAGRVLERESTGMGVTPPRGIVLYGPPGNGKTLIARQLASVVNAEFRLFSGPELISKYVGQSAENTRKIFEPAETAMKNGSKKLFVFAFDEGESLFKKRSNSDSVSSQVSNDVTNTLLSKIDGVNSLNNIIIIVMTNNMNMIDPAVLRPGRLEIHIEIPLPDRDGRCKILGIHSKKLKDNRYLGDDVDFEKIADITPNFSGAELKSVVSIATSYPLSKMVDPNTMKRITDVKPVVNMVDLVTAVSEINPVMGCISKEIKVITSTPLRLTNHSFESVYFKIKDVINEILEDSDSRNFTILLTGDNFTGKTKMVAHIVNDLLGVFSHIKFVTPETMMDDGTSIWSKYKDGLYSNEFLLVIDSIETIFDYGGGFIPKATRELLSIINSNIDFNKKVVTILTCSDLDMVKSLKLDKKVNLHLNLSTPYKVNISGEKNHINV